MLVVKVMRLHWKNRRCLSVSLDVVGLSATLVPQCCRQVLTAHVLLPHLSLWKRWCAVTGSSRQSYVEQAYPITHMGHYSILVMDKNQYGEPKPLVYYIHDTSDWRNRPFNFNSFSCTLLRWSMRQWDGCRDTQYWAVFIQGRLLSSTTLRCLREPFSLLVRTPV